MSESVRIYEVSLRDGLQNEPTVVPTAVKLAHLRRLVQAGLRDIEVTSFVRARWIPQLADAAEVVRGIPEAIAGLGIGSPGEALRFWALVPNPVGLERALDAGVGHVATVLSASETHNMKNLNRTVRESAAGLERVIGDAAREGLGVRAYISTAFGCPYEGRVEVARVVSLAKEMLHFGAHEIALGDTTGMANPEQVRRTIGALAEAGVPLAAVAVHFHDTRGTALVNAYAAWQAGIRSFDGSVAGIGGCPYAPGAAGNAATEDLVFTFHEMGVGTGVDLEALCEAGALMGEALGRALPGRVHQFHLASSARRAQTA